jgi:hypothetical protein
LPKREIARTVVLGMEPGTTRAQASDAKVGTGFAWKEAQKTKT